MPVSGSDLKLFFRRKGITQDELADRFKTTRQTISIYFNKSNPPGDFIEFATKEYGFHKPIPDGTFQHIGEQIRLHLRTKGIKQEQVAEDYGTTRQTVINYLKQVHPQPEFVTFVSENYGFKSMHDKHSNESNASEIANLSGGRIEYNKSNNEFIDIGNGQYLMIVPLVEDYAQAGYPSSFADEGYIEELPRHSVIVSQKHRGIYRAFRIKGESMDDNSSKAICDGDIATGRMIDKIHWNSKFHLHKFTDYIIVHKDGIIIKTVTDHDVENGIIGCQSRNPDKEKYADFSIKLEDVQEILNVVTVDRPWK